jgi:phosphorylase kinase alpha/beta subunit
MLIVHNEDLLAWLRPSYTVEDLRKLRAFLVSRGTFRFPQLPSGLFSAALAVSEEFGYTGYSAVWVRDNVHIARAHAVTGDTATAVKAASALLRFYGKHQNRLADILSGKTTPDEPMHRPHIRFDGTTLEELPVKWSHAQNDALGGFLWLVGRLAHFGHLQLAAEDHRLLAGFVLYLERVEFWHDEDSGHWEEARKIEASSIGTATAGLTQLRALFEQTSGADWTFAGRSVTRELLDRLVAHGHTALDAILPNECMQPDHARAHDSALLFLCYPWNIVTPGMRDRILEGVLKHLQGSHGIRRYRGDSYWCADYKRWLDPELRTADVSDDMSARDSLLRQGMEAQWCLFDPIVSILYGQRFAETRDRADLARQTHHLNRSLGQLTEAGSAFGPWKCPESYYQDDGVYVPNDATPLLWTQANLLLALHHLEEALIRVSVS